MRRIIRNERDCGMSFEMHVCLQWYLCSRLLEASALSALNCIYLRSAQNSNAYIDNDGIVMFLKCFLWSLSFLLSSRWKAKLNVRWYDSLIMQLLTGWRLRRIKWNTFSLQRSLLVFHVWPLCCGSSKQTSETPSVHYVHASWALLFRDSPVDGTSAQIKKNLIDGY